MKSFIVSHKQKEYPYVSGPYDGPIFFGRTLAENMTQPRPRSALIFQQTIFMIFSKITQEKTL